MLKNFKPGLPDFKKMVESFVAPARPTPRTAENLKAVYAESTKTLLEGGKDMILRNAQVRFIAFRDYALNDLEERVEDLPHVVNVKADPEFNPHVLKVVGDKLVGAVNTGNIISAKTGWITVDEFFDYINAGVFVFVDFKK